LIDNWHMTEKTGSRGASPKYTAAAIETMATVKFVFHEADKRWGGSVLTIPSSRSIIFWLDVAVNNSGFVCRRQRECFPLKPAQEIFVAADWNG
jgi:hypothetical protein